MHNCILRQDPKDRMHQKLPGASKLGSKPFKLPYSAIEIFDLAGRGLENYRKSRREFIWSAKPLLGLHMASAPEPK